MDRIPRVATLLSIALLGPLVAAVGLTDSPRSAVYCLFGVGLAYGSLATFFNAAALRTAPRSPSQVTALVNTAFNVEIAGGAVLGGQILHHAGEHALAPAAASVVAIGLMLATYALRSTSNTPARDKVKRTAATGTGEPAICKKPHHGTRSLYDPRFALASSCRDGSWMRLSSWSRVQLTIGPDEASSGPASCRTNIRKEPAAGVVGAGIAKKWEPRDALILNQDAP